MPHADFTESFDARDWAKAFVEYARQDPEIATDEGTMIGWFANALMRGWDEREKRLRSLGLLGNVVSDVPGEQTADPKEAFNGGPAVVCVAATAIASTASYPSPKRRDELAEERARRYTHEDGTPK